MKKDYTVTELTSMVQNFCEERDWDQFHNPKDLAIGISTEANELLDIFRFQNGTEIAQIMQKPQKREHIEEELADVLFFVLRFAQMNDLDLKDILQKKLQKNAAKYPVEKAKGRNEKYDELAEMQKKAEESAAADAKNAESSGKNENAASAVKDAASDAEKDRQYIHRDSLADGSILWEIKTRFLANKTQENLLTLLSCLRDSDMYVPVKSYEKNSLPEDTGELLLKIDILEDENQERYFPVFSSKRETPSDYQTKVEFVNLPMIKCITMAQEREGLQGMVLDPFTDAFLMPPQIAEIILELDSHLPPEERI